MKPALLLGGLLVASAAQAESYALIISIDRYPDYVTAAVLPGVAADAQLAAAMFRKMGVLPRNIHALSNEDLTYAGMAEAIASLKRRLRAGDALYLYYSGHGVQRNALLGSSQPCSEGLLTYNRRVYFDADLEKDLQDLAVVAGQVVFFNDSCFAGGASTKAFGLRGQDEDVYQIKSVSLSYAEPTKQSAVEAEGSCGHPVNAQGSTLSKAFGLAGHVLTIAASAHNEAAFSTKAGSLATRAWSTCLADPSTDANQDGVIDGRELRACAQREVDKMGRHQTITLIGQISLPIASVRP